MCIRVLETYSGEREWYKNRSIRMSQNEKSEKKRGVEEGGRKRQYERPREREREREALKVIIKVMIQQISSSITTLNKQHLHIKIARKLPYSLISC